jgi:transketolase
MTATMQLALQLNAPVYLRMGKSDRGDVHAGTVTLQAGELLRVRQGTRRIALLATGSMVKTALELTTQGLDADVWSVPSIKPLSHAQLTTIAQSVDAVITLEEHSVMGGLGAAVAEALSAIRPMPICRIGIEDRFSAFCGTWDYLLQEHGLDMGAVQQRVMRFVEGLPR